MLIAAIAALAHGVVLPSFTIVFGASLDAFTNPKDEDALVDEIAGLAKWFLILGAISFVTSFLQVRFQIIFAQRVANRLRTLYFRSLMRQTPSWYDSHDTGQLTSRVANDVSLVEAGIGDKVTSALQFLSTVVSGFIIAFIYGPLLALVILAIAPALAVGGALFGKQAADSTSTALGAYGSAAAIANEALGLIRTVSAYNGQESEARRYEKELDKAYKSGVVKAALSGFALGFTYFAIFSTFAVAFVFGASRVRSGNMETGDVIVTFFSIFIATISLGQGMSLSNSPSYASISVPFRGFTFKH